MSTKCFDIKMIYLNVRKKKNEKKNINAYIKFSLTSLLYKNEW